MTKKSDRAHIITLCRRCQQRPPGPGAWAGGRCEPCAALAGPHAPRVEPYRVMWHPLPPKHEIDRRLSLWIAQQRRGQST